MQLDWTTFLLEIVNFLILIWILQHFFYRPVLDVIARRRAAIEKTLSDAKAVEAEALAMKRQYQDRQAAWQREQEAAHARLAGEIDAERKRLTVALEASLAQAREKSRALEERGREAWRREAEDRALALGAAFVSRVLAGLSGPELEARLIGLVLEHLRQLSPDEARALMDGSGQATRRIQVASAFPVDDTRRAALATAFGALVEGTPVLEFSEDPTLVAGLRINVGPWILRANLADELAFFTSGANHGL
jgi:F-type H+-transporting ATPase subunit b